MLKRLDAYLATLPKGLDSFPDCQVKASLQRTAMEYLCPSPELIQALPPALAASVKAAPTQADPWFSQVHSVALSLAVADHRNLDGPAWTAFVRDGNRKIFNGFAMRVLLAVASPSQLVLAGRVKWNTLRRGTRLEAEASGPRSAAVKLHMPPRVFPVDYLPVIEAGFLAMLELSRAERPRITRGEVTDTLVTFDAGW